MLHHFTPCAHILICAMVFGGLGWSATAHAADGDGKSECKMEVTETGEKVCVRTRVVSRKVVRRSAKPPKHVRKSKKTSQRARKTPRKRRRWLVVDPSAHEARAGRANEAPPGQAAPQKAPAVARMAAASRPETRPAPALKQTSSQAGVSAVAPATPVEVVPGEPTASFRVEAVTDVPVLVGAGMLLETRSRLRLRSSLGVMPRGYLRLSNALIRGLDTEYPEEAEVLVEQAVDDTITWRSQVGFRPFRRAGFYVHAGYTLLGIRGDATGEELVMAAESFDEDQGELMRRMNPDTIAMSSRLHMVDVEFGWDFALGERANLRLGAGWAYTMHSKTSVEASFDDTSGMDADEIALFEDISGKYLDAIYRRFVHPPSLSLAFGLRF